MRLLVLIFFINIALLAIALIDCLSTDREEIRTLPKTAWVLDHPTVASCRSGHMVRFRSTRAVSDTIG